MKSWESYHIKKLRVMARETIKAARELTRLVQRRKPESKSNLTKQILFSHAAN